MASLTRQERDQLLSEIDRLTKQLYAGEEEDTAGDAPSEIYESIKANKEAYLNGLPRLTAGRCPFCSAPLVQTIDTYGLDGPWWDVFGPDLKPDSCPHFLVMLGALHFHGLTPLDVGPEPPHEIDTGPEVPYVIPRILDLPGTRCVIHSAGLVNDKFTAYFISYFSDPPLPAEQGCQPWLRRQYMYKDKDGNLLWNRRNDPWDFEIDRWLDRAPPKLSWIDPAAPDGPVRSEPPAKCPYVGLPGRRESLAVRRGRVTAFPAPNGTPMDEGIFD